MRQNGSWIQHIPRMKLHNSIVALQRFKERPTAINKPMRQMRNTIHTMPRLHIFRVAAAVAVIACGYEPLTSTVLGIAPTFEWAKIAEPPGWNGGAAEIGVLLPPPASSFGNAPVLERLNK
jgi:hypothetical protein